MNRFKDYIDIEVIKLDYQPGTRVVLEKLNDKYLKLKPGTEGTVTYVDDRGTVFVKWDSGYTLGLLVGEDYFRKVGVKE